MSSTRQTIKHADFEAVIFDAGGVLILPDATVLGPAFAPFGGSTLLDDHHRAHYAAMRAKSHAGAPEGQWRTYHEAYLRAIGVREDSMDVALELFSDLLSAHLWRQPITESISVLRVLAERGVPMAVVSNAAGQVEAALGRLGICQVGPGDGTAMRTVVDSAVVGATKPDPRIFEFALDYFREFDRSHILYVGDSVTMDITGAAAAGMPAVLIDPYDDHDGERFPRIRSLVDLL